MTHSEPGSSKLGTALNADDSDHLALATIKFRKQIEPKMHNHTGLG